LSIRSSRPLQSTIVVGEAEPLAALVARAPRSYRRDRFCYHATLRRHVAANRIEAPGGGTTDYAIESC
jgi:hypothetical protein